MCAVIQRLGNDGLLIGSRRRMGAAPLVVGGADPVAAEITTTAGLGDGAHNLLSCLMLLHSNGIQTRRSLLQGLWSLEHR